MPLETSIRLVANGINAVTGQYDLAPIEARELAARLRKGAVADAGVKRHDTDRGLRLKTRAFPALPLGTHPENIAEAGWGIVFHRDEDSRVKAALAPLIAHRRKQIGNDSLVHELTYYPNDTIEKWLTANNTAWGDIQPTRVPYYLLVVGTPERIPFSFIHALDAEYCVGLLGFDDADDYAQYAKSVIDYETQADVPNRREAVFFGTRHPFDDATTLSADWLVTPLTDGLPAMGLTPARPPVAQQWKFGQRKFVAENATRQALLDVLTPQSNPPSILFSASHGMVWPNGDAHQLNAQGALLCQDWSGFGSIAPAHYLTAADVPDGARVHGLIAFFFACFGAGTPDRDRFSHEPDTEPPALAPRPFFAKLPQRLLAHPGGGALACIGHIERAWGYSIVGQSSEPQIGPFQRALGRLMLGQPVGLAVQEFNDKCAAASVALTSLLEQAYARRPVDDAQLSVTWAERNDAEGYVALGDPAVKLRIDKLVAA